MSRDAHPAFLAALPEHRWRRPLRDLMGYLSVGAAREYPRWCAVILPSGARVAMRADIETGREIVIYRREPATASDAQRRWRNELATFERHLGIGEWGKDLLTMEGGGLKAVYREGSKSRDIFDSEK